MTSPRVLPSGSTSGWLLIAGVGLVSASLGAIAYAGVYCFVRWWTRA